MPVKVAYLDDGGYRYRLRAPERLQVIAGIPIETTGMRFTLGGTRGAKDLITAPFCPAGGWRYRLTAHYLRDLTGLTSRDTVAGSIACTS
jgi:hypothetical protein